MDAGTWATLVGDALAAAAIVVAVWTLGHAQKTAEQSRKDLREDRRIDFLQSVILDTAVDFSEWARGGPVSPDLIAARVRVLPGGMLPLLRAALGLPVPAEIQRTYGRLLVAKGVKSPIGRVDWEYGYYVREEVLNEINEALDRLNQRRP